MYVIRLQHKCNELPMTYESRGHKPCHSLTSCRVPCSRPSNTRRTNEDPLFPLGFLSLARFLKQATDRKYKGSVHPFGKGSLGEREMLWDHESKCYCFHSLFEFSQTSTSVLFNK